MSTVTETESKRERTTLYVVLAGAVVVLMVIGLFTYRGAKESREAEDKANQFIAALAQAGARTPSQDQVVRVLGNDGGAVCENPNDALSRAVFRSMLMNGAAGPGERPVIVDSRALQGQLLIMKIYCPDELPDFQNFVNDLKTGDVTGG